MKVGIVGLGARISNVACKFKTAKPDLDFTAYVDPTPAGLKALEEANGRALEAYDTVEEMLASEGLDFLMIGSPNFMHMDHLRAALQSDVPHIFTEKPVVISEQETFDLLELMRDNGGHERVSVGLVLRYSPLYVALRKSIADGQLGDIVSIEASEHIGPHHGSFFMRDWRRYTSQSGGFMLEKCCHDIDLYQGAVGARPMRVASFGGRKSFVPENKPPADHSYARQSAEGGAHAFVPRWGGGNSDFESDGDIVDYQTAIVEYENGANLCFHTNINVPDDFRRFAVMGTKGQAEGDFVRNYFKVHDALTLKRLVDIPKFEGAMNGHYGADDAIARDMVAHFETGADLPVSVLDALEAGITAIKIDEAREAGTVVDLTETWEQFDSYGLS